MGVWVGGGGGTMYNEIEIEQRHTSRKLQPSKYDSAQIQTAFLVIEGKTENQTYILILNC